jgi:hypothetical protein
LEKCRESRFDGWDIDAGGPRDAHEDEGWNGHAKQEDYADAQRQERDIRNQAMKPRIKETERKAEWRKRKGRIKGGKSEGRKEQPGANDGAKAGDGWHG